MANGPYSVAWKQRNDFRVVGSMAATDLDYAALHRGYTFTIASRSPCFSIPPFNLRVNNLLNTNGGK